MFAPPGFLTPTGVRPLATFALQRSFYLSEEFSDNFNHSSSDKQQNLRSGLASTVTLTINGARTQGLVGYRLGVSHDTATNQFSLDTGLNGGGRIAYDLTPRITLTVSDFITRSDDPFLADRLFLQRERAKFTSNVFGVDADYRQRIYTASLYYRLSQFFAPTGPDTTSHTAGARVGATILGRTTAGAGYEHLESETGRQTISGDQFTLSLARLLSPLTTVGVAGSYATRQVSSTQLVSPIPGFFTPIGETISGDFSSWTVSAFSTRIIPNGALSGSLGYSRVIPKRGPEQSSIFSLSVLSYRFARANATLSFDQGFSETFAESGNRGVVKTRGATFALSYPITPRITGTGTLFYRENQFPGIAGRAGGTEDTYGGGLAVFIPLYRWLSGVLGYDHFEATGGRQPFSENRVRASLSATF